MPASSWYNAKMMIQTNALTKSYGKHRVADALTLKIPKGQIFGLYAELNMLQNIRFYASLHGVIDERDVDR